LVVRIRNGSAEWVNAQTGELDGKLVEVFGGLQKGDTIAVRGADEVRQGARVNVHPRAAEQPSAK